MGQSTISQAGKPNRKNGLNLTQPKNNKESIWTLDYSVVLKARWKITTLSLRYSHKYWRDFENVLIFTWNNIFPIKLHYFEIEK